MICSASLMRGRFMLGLAVCKRLIGVVASAAIVGQLSGCSKRPDFAGVYFLPSNSSDSQWSTDSLLKLREDGTATVEGINFHLLGASETHSRMATRGEGKWRVERNKIIYEGEIETASTFGDSDYEGSEPMRLVFTIASNGDLLLSAEDMTSDSVRYIKERQIRGSN